MNGSSPPPAPPLASVIVPCLGRSEEDIRRCVAALARHTRPPWELIAVGASEGLAGYLRGVRDAGAFPVESLGGAEARDARAAWRRGLDAARGEFLALVDGDAVVTDAWLDQLVALAASDPAIGMAGPMSNAAAPPQLVADVPYRDPDAMHRFAAGWRAERRGRWFAAAGLSGPCALVKRAALAEAEGMEADPGSGFVEDLARRISRAGRGLVVAFDLFVHGRDGPGDEAEASGEVGRPGVPLEDLPAGLPIPRLDPGNSREMVGQCLAILAAFEGPAGRRAALWERLAAQVAEHGRRNGSTWGMERLQGADGSIIYMGRASEFLVFDPGGGLSRGRGAGCLAGSRAGLLLPDYAALKAVR